MTLSNITPQQRDQIRADLETLGVQGSSLLAIPAFQQTSDSHEYIREIFLAFLRAMFRSMDPGSYRWDPEDTKTEVHITYADPRNSAEKSTSPAISVELGPFTFSSGGINDLLGMEADGTSVHTAMRNGTVVIRCRSSTKLEADSLASVITGSIKYMHDDLERLAGFVYTDAYTSNPSSGEMQTISPAGDIFVSNVVANVHYQESWRKGPRTKIKGPVVFEANPQGVFLS